MTYTITVSRKGKDNGRLKFETDNVKVDTECWWDPDVTIKSGTYKTCSKTRMATKKDSVTGEDRPGVYLPDAVSPDSGEKTIFLHEGKNPGWSDGCIVLVRDEMMKMWNEIKPDNAGNVTVIVSDG